MAGYSITCKTRNEFDARPVSALSAQIDSFSCVRPTRPMSAFEPVTGVMIKILMENSARNHVLSTPCKLHFCRNYLVVFCRLSLLSLMLLSVLAYLLELSKVLSSSHVPKYLLSILTN